MGVVLDRTSVMYLVRRFEKNERKALTLENDAEFRLR